MDNCAAAGLSDWPCYRDGVVAFVGVGSEVTADATLTCMPRTITALSNSCSRQWIRSGRRYERRPGRSSVLGSTQPACDTSPSTSPTARALCERCTCPQDDGNPKPLLTVVGQW